MLLAARTPKKTLKVSINDRFYKVFCQTFLEALRGIQSGIPGLAELRLLFFWDPGPGQAATSFFLRSGAWPGCDLFFVRSAPWPGQRPLFLRLSHWPEVAAPSNYLFSTGFIRFSYMAEHHVVYSENLLLLDAFRSQNAKMVPKVSINNRFYKVFCSTFLQAPERSVPNGFWCLAKSWNGINL